MLYLLSISLSLCLLKPKNSQVGKTFDSSLNFSIRAHVKNEDKERTMHLKDGSISIGPGTQSKPGSSISVMSLRCRILLKDIFDYVFSRLGDKVFVLERANTILSN